jgi:alkanesulfonate monooxygenase SsuD/methylene tetrahydromethanopterin reductase-like flavin-dependent oxidoreductase (luciferase family)
VRFGTLTLPNRPWGELLRQWRALDEQGWDAVYVADHLANPYIPEQPWLDGWTCLGTMATVIEQAAIGPLVTPMTFRNPAAVARAALSVAHVARGRLELGLGAGGSPVDHELAGVESWAPRERLERFEIHVRRIRALLDDDDPLVSPPPRPRIPITIGGSSPGLVRLAATVADAWNTYVGRGLSAEEGRAAAARQLGLLEGAASGRSEPPPVRRSVLLGHRFVAEEPFRSEESFADVARAWRALGFDELVVYADPSLMVPRGVEPPPDIVARVARDVLPELRRETQGSPAA